MVARAPYLMLQEIDGGLGNGNNRLPFSPLRIDGYGQACLVVLELLSVYLARRMSLATNALRESRRDQ